MKRYDIKATSDYLGWEYTEAQDGEWVKYEDVITHGTMKVFNEQRDIIDIHAKRIAELEEDLLEIVTKNIKQEERIAELKAEVACEEQRLSDLWEQFCAVVKEKEQLKAAITAYLNNNGHLADGDNCTLIALEDAFMKQPPYSCVPCKHYEVPLDSSPCVSCKDHEKFEPKLIDKDSYRKIVDYKKCAKANAQVTWNAAYSAGLRRAVEICTEDGSDDGTSHDKIWNTACRANAAAIREEIKR